MADRTEDTVDVEYQQGGMLEFGKTGIYPEYLIVTSKKWGRRWRKSISGDKKEGLLHMNKKPFYKYRVTDGEVFIFDMDGNPVGIDIMSYSMVD